MIQRQAAEHDASLSITAARLSDKGGLSWTDLRSTTQSLVQAAVSDRRLPAMTLRELEDLLQSSIVIFCQHANDALRDKTKSPPPHEDCATRNPGHNPTGHVSDIDIER
jgi:hypothetical protein